MTERGQVKARQYTTVQRLIAAQVTAFLIIGPDVIGYYQNHHKTAGKRAALNQKRDGKRSKFEALNNWEMYASKKKRTNRCSISKAIKIRENY